MEIYSVVMYTSCPNTSFPDCIWALAFSFPIDITPSVPISIAKFERKKLVDVLFSINVAQEKATGFGIS